MIITESSERTYSSFQDSCLFVLILFSSSDAVLFARYVSLGKKRRRITSSHSTTPTAQKKRLVLIHTGVCRKVLDFVASPPSPVGRSSIGLVWSFMSGFPVCESWFLTRLSICLARECFNRCRVCPSGCLCSCHDFMCFPPLFNALV